DGSVDSETLSRAAGAALRAPAVRDQGAGRVALALPARTADEVEAVALGAQIGNDACDRYSTAEETKQKAEKSATATFSLISSATGAEAAAERATVLAEAVTFARDLGHTAPTDLVPEDLASAAQEIAQQADLQIEVLDEQALAEGGCGGLTGVGQGSKSPPRLGRLSYSHPEATTSGADVGKGITCEGGGLRLRPARPMYWMKSDMPGAASVLAAR